jgi:hypothetical protein
VLDERKARNTSGGYKQVDRPLGQQRGDQVARDRDGEEGLGHGV